MQKKTYLLMAIVVILSLLASTTALAQTGGNPHGAVPVQGDASTDVASQAAVSGPVSVVVHLDKASLASVGKFMSAAERVQYAAEVAALQDQVAAQVEALGGTVLGRLKPCPAVWLCASMPPACRICAPWQMSQPYAALAPMSST